MTHTPGNWEANGCTVYSGKTILAVTYCEGNRELHPNMLDEETPPDSNGEHGDGWEEAWKNADLIAAAPEMLAALKDAEFLLRKAGLMAGPMRDSFNRSAGDAREAIAKAEGNA
jgi:hypothetical protein